MKGWGRRSLLTVGSVCWSERREEVDDDLYHFQAKAGLTSLLLIRGGEDIKARRVIISLTDSRESPGCFRSFYIFITSTVSRILQSWKVLY